jgi:hypothetical protein
MAFTGTPVVKQITDGMVRITGVSLGVAAAGVIMLHGAASPPVGAIVLPEGFIVNTYEYSNTPGLVTLQDCIDVTCKRASTGATTTIPISTVKTGTTHADFRATLTNGDAEDVTSDLEIYVRNHT